MKLVYVGGVPGVGKSTSSKGISELYPNSLTYVSSGEIKRPEARRRFGKSLSNLNQKETLEINSYFFDELKNFNGNIFIVDSHFTYPILPHRNEFVRLIPRDFIIDLNILLLFETTPEEIVKRRIFCGREDDSIKTDFVRKELKEERREAEFISNNYGIPLEVIVTDKEVNVITATFGRVLEDYGLLEI